MDNQHVKFKLASIFILLTSIGGIISTIFKIVSSMIIVVGLGFLFELYRFGSFVDLLSIKIEAYDVALVLIVTILATELILEIVKIVLGFRYFITYRKGNPNIRSGKIVLIVNLIKTTANFILSILVVIAIVAYSIRLGAELIFTLDSIFFYIEVIIGILAYLLTPIAGALINIYAYSILNKYEKDNNFLVNNN